MIQAPRSSLRVSRRFDAPAKRVFDAWLDARSAGQWLFATPTGTMVDVQIDAKVGGAFRFVDRRDGVDVAHIGQYLEIDRPKRLIFSFAVATYSTDTTIATVDILAQGSGCKLTLSHDAPADMKERIEAGWILVLDALAATLDRSGR
jgi:uncharacterized protein YndB with AHSA1/START domain